MSNPVEEKRAKQVVNIIQQDNFNVNKDKSKEFEDMTDIEQYF